MPVITTRLSKRGAVLDGNMSTQAVVKGLWYKALPKLESILTYFISKHNYKV